MISLIYTALTHSRTVLLFAALILLSGLVSYFSIPRESFPNVSIPFVNIHVWHEGISPEDADRLLVGPIYKQIKSLEGIKEIKSVGAPSHANLVIEFDQRVDISKAMIDVREKIDMAKAELPADSEEPQAAEYNIALQPILSIALAGDNINQRVLFSIAQKSKDELETITGVLEASIQGKPDEVVEILVNPRQLESYNINQSDLINLVARNNKLVAAGTLKTAHGKFAVKVPGLFETVDDILNLPVKQNGQHVVKLSDIATVHRTFDDPASLVRLNGKPMISLDVSKRTGANIIDISDQLKQKMASLQSHWPEGMFVEYLQDESRHVRDYLSDLQNSVALATLLMMILIIATLGIKNGLMVGLSIPCSFLIGMLFLSLLDMTLNIVVLFSLILAVGMLTDASIVIVEYADRRFREGQSKRDAYAEASIRMAWPLAASITTTLAVFMPLLFWPGIMGQFMLYLPITLIFTLSAAFVVAMILIPTIGSLGEKTRLKFKPEDLLNAPAEDALDELDRYSLWYSKKLKVALQHPKKVLGFSIAIFISSITIYNIFGHGTIFFPESDAEFASIYIKARGEMALQEKDQIIKLVEQKVIGTPGIKSYYTTVYDNPPSQASADTIGIIRLEMSYWKIRPKAAEIFQQLRQQLKNIPGVIIEVRAAENGPAAGRDIDLELTAPVYRDLLAAMDPALEMLRNTPGLIDVQDSRPPPGFEWQLQVNREKASQFGVDITHIGDTIRMVTNGVKLGEYRPDDADDEIDIKLRYPTDYRSLSQFDQLRVIFNDKLIPVGGFVEQKAMPKLASVNRTNGRFALHIEADLEEGYLANDLIPQLLPELNKILPKDVSAHFTGKNEDQQESMMFLLKAFGVALFLMAIILVTQFNSFYQAFLILTVIIFSINGALWGLLFKGEPFSIVMGGVGIISLAGIVINNNIILIDSYNIMRRQGLDVFSAAWYSAAQRFRPIMLTTITTICSLLPMMFEINIKLLSQEIDFGAPSAQTWSQLSTVIATGMIFATPIALFLTPCLLLLRDRKNTVIS